MAGRVGQQLGNYKLLSLLGQGGFAEVYLGEHIYLETPAAIKVLHTQLDNEEGEAFRQEARTIARLVHPHIVRVLEFGVEATTPFLVVDYAPNGTLRKRHSKGMPLPLATVASYVTQVAEALQYAHEQKIIHRDVKPENMLIGRYNEILLSDFGIAVMAQSTHDRSTQGLQELAGTIAYMAPEQIQSQAAPSSDQYSLAVVAYEWLVGSRPFQGSFTEVAVKHTLTLPPSLREKIATLPLSVEEVVMKALSKDPKQRFPTVREFAVALKRASSQETGSAPLHDISDPLVQSAESTHTAVLSNAEDASLVTVPISLSQALSTTSPAAEASQSPAETSALAQSMEILTPQPVRSMRRRVSRRRVLVGLAGIAAVSVVGGSIAFLTHPRALRNTSSTQPADGQGTTLYTFYGHTDWVWAVAWSPKGNRIVSASGDGTAQVWDAKDGGHLNIYSGHADSVYGVSWSPDDARIASAGNDRTVQIWDAIYSDHFYTYTGHTSGVRSITWSPDGKHIASGSWDKTVRVWRAS
ncbi:MAG: hypothetical protein NVS4B7_01430 [Ktedonobacteraceae bacterium]